MMESIFLEGFTDDERHAGINKIRHSVSKYGDIVDFHFFSDVSLSMTILIEEYKIDQLYKELLSVISIQKLDYFHSISTKERTVYLNITFSKGTGNLKIEVPHVPG